MSIYVFDQLVSGQKFLHVWCACVCVCVCVCVCNRERQRETEERMSDLNINKRDGIDGHNVNYFGDTRWDLSKSIWSRADHQQTAKCNVIRNTKVLLMDEETLYMNMVTPLTEYKNMSKYIKCFNKCNKILTKSLKSSVS